MAAAPCPGAHTEPRFDQKNQIKSPKNVALHLRNATPHQAKSMTYATSTRANCRRSAKRDPFEMGMGEWKKANFWFSGALAGPVTAYIYDWNLLPIGQALWLKELETYKEFPPLQDPASYNLDQVIEELKKAPTHTRASSLDACG